MEESFERTLEAVASLAVRLDNQGIALGLVTNGLISGGNLSVLPISRTPQQLSDILEILARLQMKSKGDLVNLLKHGLELPRDLSCVYFSYEKDDTNFATTQFFDRFKIPVVSIVCKPSCHPRGNDSEIGGKTYRLDEIYGE